VVTVIEVPKTWKKIGDNCYLDEIGNPHIVTKTSYKTDEKLRKLPLQYARQNKEKARKRTALWRKRNPKKIKQYNDNYSKSNRECLTTMNVVSWHTRPSMRQNKKKLIEKYVQEGRSRTCADFNHKGCKAIRVSCTCDCHD